MAVDLQTLRESQRPLNDRILELLEANPNEAFNAFDVYAALEGLSAEASAILALVSVAARKPPPKFIECRDALEAMAAGGQIEAAEYAGSRHFYARTA